jgi:hypothetical protein
MHWLRVSVPLGLVVALGCGPTIDPSDGDGGASGTSSGAEPDSATGAAGQVDSLCGGGEPFSDACLDAYQTLCESRTDASSCEDTAPVPGGLSLMCRWAIPTRYTLSGRECLVQPAAGTCVGIAYPGDIGCTQYALAPDGTGVLELPPETECFALGWETTCDWPECSCIEP